MKRQLDAACSQYQVKDAEGAGHAEWPDSLKSGFPSVKMLGKAAQAAEPTSDTPQEVKCNTATVRSCGKNLFNTRLIPVQSEVISTSTCWISEVGDDYVVVSESDIYEWSGNVGTGLTLHQLAPGLIAGEKYTLQFETESSNQTCMLLNGANKLWIRGSSMEITEELLASEVRLFGKSVYHGEARGDCRISNIQIEKGSVATAYEPYHDGGEATAPNLMCAANGSCQSTYDPQTGEFVNWWWDKIVFDGSESWTLFPSRNGFVCWSKIPEVMWRNAYWCNQCVPANEGGEYFDKMSLLMGVSSQSMYVCYCPFYDDTLDDAGLANWKAHLTEHPLEVWVARNEPEVTNIGPSRLTCPTGYGQIIQVAGDVPDCPLEVKYLSHGGNVK